MQSVYDLASQIEHCSQDGYLTNLLNDIFRQLDITSFIFVTMLERSKDPSTYRYHIGCNPNWYNVYNKQKQHVIDPFLVYARGFSKLLLLSEVKSQASQSPEQIDFFSNLEAHGFRSGMVVPAHAAGNRIGMLLVGTDATDGDEQLLKHRMILRAISMSMLEWWIDRIVPKNLNIQALTKEHVKMLKLASQEGVTSREIAISLNMTDSQVSNRFRVINDIFHVRNYKDAAAKALELGVIKPF